VPAQLAAALPNPLVMLVAPQVQAVSPREVLWSGNILTHLQVASWEEAIAALVDRLIERQQVPAAWRDFLLERARAREQRASTALGCETAFPHILIPDYYGLAVAFAVVPDGVYFTDREVGPVRFICLLIIPESCYGQYLGLIANLARLLVLPAVRAELLQATHPKAVLQILAPEEEDDEWANETSPGLRGE
jgi:mannitol/fructose-specific phosphotransferase system IIA component (Ntr-type)